MDDYIDHFLAEVRAKQERWRSQAQKDAQALEVKQAGYSYSTPAWRYNLGIKLIRLGKWLAQIQGGSAISKLN